MTIKEIIIMKKFLLMFSTLLFSSEVFSNQINVVNLEEINDYTHSVYISLGEVNFDSEIANLERVKDSATYLKLGYEGKNNQLIYGGGLSGFFYSDRNRFNQLTEDPFGDISRQSSSAEAFNLYFEGGYSYQFSHYWSFDMLFGHELVLSSERSISNCSNCFSEDIDIDSGLYFIPRIKLLPNDSNLIWSLSYQYYLSGDVENAAYLTLGYKYW